MRCVIKKLKKDLVLDGVLFPEEKEIYCSDRYKDKGYHVVFVHNGWFQVPNEYFGEEIERMVAKE